MVSHNHSNANTPAGPAVPALGARALILGASDKKRVSCTSEALVVSNQRQQTFRYPVARIARVVCASTTDWSGAALALCLRRSIPITWIDTHGTAMGTCYPQTRGSANFATALEVMCAAPDGFTLYQHWQRARRMETLIRWSQAEPQTINPQQWETTKRQWVYAGEYTAHLPTAMRGLCLAYVAAQLTRHGLPPVLWGPQTQRIDLDEDLCELLWAEMNLKVGNLADTATQTAPITDLFERWAARNASALLLHIHSLQRSAMRALAQ